MHFKCALIVCAVYFLTSAWSSGLNSDQLERLQVLYKPYKMTTNGVGEDEIRQVVENTFKMEWKDPTIEFGYHLDQPDAINLFHLLWMVVYNEIKRTDKTKVKKLTILEVCFYLEEFEERFKSHEQTGYLYLDQLSAVFDYWQTVNLALNKKIKNIQTENDGEYVMNAVDFLLTMIEIKPKGLGLTLAQIKMFIALYETYKTSHGINAAASREVFQNLGIEIDDDLEKLFKSKRAAEILLMDLISVAAERNMTVPINERRVLRVIDVIDDTRYFNYMDKDKDGLLSSDEYLDRVKSISDLASLEGPSEVFDRAQHYINNIFKGNKAINIAEYIEVHLLLVNLEDRIESDDDNFDDDDGNSQ